VPIAAGAFGIPRPAAAAGVADGVLAAVWFGYKVLEVVDKVVDAYNWVRGRDVVINRSDRVHKGVVGSVIGYRGLIELQEYKVIFVPPMLAQFIEISIRVGESPGPKVLQCRSAVDYASGNFRVITSLR
jgi:hypothetical protein